MNTNKKTIEVSEDVLRQAIALVEKKNSLWGTIAKIAVGLIGGALSALGYVTFC